MNALSKATEPRRLDAPIWNESRSAGIYVHLPFCVVRCTYCDFYSLVDQDQLAAAYTRALAGEIQRFPERAGYRPTVRSVYIGGGTPSHLPEGSIAEILDAIGAAFALESGAEITVEANPESASPEKLREFRSAGANRLSLGVQSFKPAMLKMMGRPHGAEEPPRTIEAARRAGFENVSLDLIYGLPGQDATAWTEDLDAAMALETEHLSAYLLETDKDTPLARLMASGSLEEPDAGTIETLYRITESRLPAAGFSRYEVSNWARPGRASVHNLGYWTDRPYIGFGSSSHSYYLEVRRACRLGAAAYIEAVEKGEETRVDLDDGSRQVRLSEAMVTALRLAEGADLDVIGSRYGLDLWSTHAADLQELQRRGWAVVEPPRVRLTVEGILWSMDALAPFVSSGPSIS